ncbi:MAG: preprotein translocase subunit SecY [Candidatus Pacebacteria bacterium]|nr:preprotein translocase subunit SecY [Candidatus Paceibacterota bacterium]
MNTFIEKCKLVIQDRTLRNRVLFMLGSLVVFRLLAAVPIPGVDIAKLNIFFNSNQFFGLLNVFSGGGLSTLSIVMLGVGPYITASIIMQLLTMMSPTLKAMYQEEGELGRKKFSQYSRILTVPLAFIQAFGFIVLLERQGVVGALSGISLITNVITIVSGSILLMWVGELMTEFGIGNGVSMIIFSGIVSRIPQALNQTLFSFDQSQIPMYTGVFIMTLVVIYLVVIVTEAERPLPVTYSKRVRGNKVYGGISTYLPLRLNQAGVIPIIFALSILLFPQMIFNLLSHLGNATISGISTQILNIIANQWVYAGAYFMLVFLFTYFYTAVTFDPHMISTNLQRGGAFIPGIRPGEPTSEYLSKVVTRITLVGAIFLGVIAVLPVILPLIVPGVPKSLAVGGTALLIVVSVVLDLVKKIDAQISMREY